MRPHTSQVFWPETGTLGYAGQHPRANFVAIVGGEHEIGSVWACEHRMGPADMRLVGPANAPHGREPPAGFGGRPLAHATTAKTSLIAGTGSPCSRRSAKTRSAKTCARAMASSRVCP